MIRYALPAAIAALALGAPIAANAQTAMPPQVMPVTTPNTSVNANAAIVGQPQPGPDDYYSGVQTPLPVYPGAPMPGPFAQPAPMTVSPRTVWIPGAYNWDPNRQTYAWTQGQYVEAPTEDARWVPGHWAETPTSWIWVDGRWN